MSLDDFFVSVDTNSSYEEGEDAYGNKFRERWNDMPEVGGTLRQKGNTAASVTLLERYTGTQTRPRKNGDQLAAELGPEPSFHGAVSEAATKNISSRIARNRTDMQDIRQQETLEGRDPTIYNGYNFVNRGVFRNNGREQVRGFSVDDRMGTVAMPHTKAMISGATTPTHKTGNVNIAEAVHGMHSTMAATPLVAAHDVRMDGGDALPANTSSRVSQTPAGSITADYVLGSRDSSAASSARRVTSMAHHNSLGGDMPVSKWDSVASIRTGSARTYSQYATSTPAYELSKVDSTPGGPTRRTYRNAASVSGRHALSKADSVANERIEDRTFAPFQATSGRISDVRRNDVRERGHHEDAPERMRMAAIAGKRAKDRRLGPTAPLPADPHHDGLRVQAEGGKVTRQQRRPDMTFPMNSANVEGEQASAGVVAMNTSESRRIRSETNTRRNGLSHLVEMVRTTFLGGSVNDKRAAVTRFENKQQPTQYASNQGVNTRKTPDDSVMRSHDIVKTGESVHSLPGEATGMNRDTSMPMDLAREQRQSQLADRPAIRESAKGRGMDVVDPVNMMRTARVE